jgi:hypothetical protein
MLSTVTLEYLSTLRYRADAKRQVCWLPLAGIYWDDELPDIQHLMQITEDDRNKIFRLFGIRVRIWKREALSYEDQQFWDTAQSLVPDWAFFRRQRVSADDLQLQQQAEQATTEALEAWFADADHAEVTQKDGVQSFSLTFDLTRKRPAPPQKPSFWERIFRRKRHDGNSHLS